MKLFFEKIFRYHLDTNQMVIEVIKQNQEQVSDRTFDLYSHILNAHQIWMARILGLEPRGVFDKLPIVEWHSLNEQNHKQTQQVLQSRELDVVLSYVNSKGMSYDKVVSDILFHVANHTTHHRGQVISDLRMNGIAPPVTDYIFYRQ